MSKCVIKTFHIKKNEMLNTFMLVVYYAFVLERFEIHLDNN